MLLEAGLTHQILHEQLLLERLDDYRVVVLPDQRHVPEALVERLGPWVEAGGTLIASYRTATLNADMQPLTRPALESLLGISLDGDYPHDHVYVDVPDGALGDDLPELPMLVWAPSTLITPTEAEVVADLRAIYVRDDGQPLLRSSPPGEALGRPAITRHQVGAGNAIYVAPEAFSAYTRRGQWMLMQVLARLIVQGVGTPIAQVDRPDVEVVLARRAGTLLLQLVNRVVPMAQGSANAFSQRVMPLTDVAVHVALDRAPSGVTWQPQGHELSATWQDGVCQVVVPQLCIHGVVEIAS